MKTTDLSKDSFLALQSRSDIHELNEFNTRRTIRGLQPVTQDEYDELTLKVLTKWSANDLNEQSIH